MRKSVFATLRSFTNNEVAVRVKLLHPICKLFYEAFTRVYIY